MARGNPNWGKKSVDAVPETVEVGSVEATAEAVAKATDKALSDKREEAREEAAHEAKIQAPLGMKTMFKIVIPKQSNTDSNKPVFVPNHEGGKDWWLERGKEYLVPEYVVNILRESIAVSTEYEFETSPQGVRTIPKVESISRFSLDIRGEIRV